MAARGAAWFLVAAGCLACAPAYHRAAPYRNDPQRAAALERHAAEVCAASGTVNQPSERFFTDGCSWFPDGTWQGCCVEHDIAYWCGGSRRQRCAADRALADCVARSDPTWRGTVLGPLMRGGVGLGGAPWLPTYFRWGFGHAWPGGYDDGVEPTQ